ncbi:M28 family peptidase [Noviherbaspirillum sp. ST9]|uniref:M28 family peptidase n=1 Tax=Noviherbaspirillum sp. ST9 TaxID=3401606 RepID=UPI003B586DBC
MVMAPLLGAVALAGSGVGYMTSMPGESFRGPLPPLTSEEESLAHRLREHVEHIAREEHNTANPGQLDDVARYLESTLAGFGYAVKQQIFSVDGNRVRNLEVSVRSPGPAEGKPRIVVVGAHYDSAPGTSGANDNATGSAAVIELARALQETKPEPGHEIRLVLFVNEEAPYFKTAQMGSLHHASDMKTRGENVAAMLSLETIGYYALEKGSQRYPPPLAALYPDTGNFLAFVGDLGARELVRDVLASFRRHAKFPSEGLAAPATVPGVDWSDHWSYRKHGYPALMITDTAPYRYPYYHTAQDTPDKLDYTLLARVVKGIEFVVRDLAAAP